MPLQPEGVDFGPAQLRRSGRLLFPLTDPESSSARSDLISLMGAGEGVMARTRAVVKIQGTGSDGTGPSGAHFPQTTAEVGAETDV